MALTKKEATKRKQPFHLKIHDELSSATSGDGNEVLQASGDSSSVTKDEATRGKTGFCCVKNVAKSVTLCQMLHGNAKMRSPLLLSSIIIDQQIISSVKMSALSIENYVIIPSDYTYNSV